MKLKRISPRYNSDKLEYILESVRENYYLTTGYIEDDYHKYNLYGMFDNDNLLCSCSIEYYNEFVFMKRFVMVREHGNQYFKKMVKLILEIEPHICLTIEPTNYKVASILKELGFGYVGKVLDRTGTYTYELYQGGKRNDKI